MRRFVLLLSVLLAAASMSFAGPDAGATLDHATPATTTVRCPPPEPIDLRLLIAGLAAEPQLRPAAETSSFSTFAH